MKNNKILKTPDFIGIGVMKAASTWIFENLKKHPQICGAKTKEIHFFDQHKYKKGIKHYCNFFSHCSSNKIKGEFTPGYIYDSKTPGRIYHYFPNIKLIACLRNPVDRAYSEYRYAHELKGRLNWYDSFIEALQQDKTFKNKGFYYNQLKRYFKLFPSKNIKIMIFDDLKQDPLKFIQELYRFLGASNTNFIPQNLTKKNVTGTRKTTHKIPLINPILYWIRRKINKESWADIFFKKIGIKNWLREVVKNNKKIILTNKNRPKNKELSKEERKKVYNLYKDDIKKLEKLIKKDLSSWKMQ